MNPSTTMFSMWTRAALSLAFLAILAGGAWSYRIHEETMRQKVEENLTAIARLKVDQITAWRNNQLQDAGLIAENHVLLRETERYLTAPGDKTLREIHLILHQIAQEHDYSDIVWVDPQGQIRLALSGKAAAGHAEELQAWTTAGHVRTPVLVKLHADAEAAAPHISVLAPLVSADGPNGRLLGGLILVSDASRFLFSLLHSWPTPSPTGETLLVRRDNDQALFLNDLRHRDDAALKLRVPVSQTDVPAVMAVLGRKGFVRGKDYRGVEVAAVIMPVPGTPAFMIAKVDSDELFAEWYFDSAIMLAFFLALMAIIGGIGFSLWQRDKKAHYRTLYLSESALRTNIERHSIILRAIGDAVIATDIQSRVELLNPVAESLTGWTLAEAIGRPVAEVFCIVNEETRKKVESPVTRVLREGVVVGLANHTLLITRDGTEVPIADSGSPIRDEKGEITGVVLIFRDQRKERQALRLTHARLDLIEYAATHTLEELLTKALDQITAIACSPIGFIHFVESDQQTLSLQQWSTRTLKEFCRAEGSGMHYPIEEAGVWVDCVRDQKPVIHNDYEALPHKKGLPEGHATIIRELVAPILREGKVVAILGVGNKPVDYTEEDVKIVSFLADVTWEIAKRKQNEARLQYLSAIVEQSTEGMAIAELDGTITYANDAWCTMHGYTSPEELIGQNLSIFFHSKEQMEQDVQPFNEKVMQHGTFTGEVGHVTREGKPFPTFMTTTLLKNKQDEPLALAAIAKDITEIKKIEAQLRQAQKMESVGQLAGGVAHDYNNMLSVILGYAELALTKLEPGDPLHADLKEIRSAAKRSAAITRQLLAFARKQAIAPRVLDLNETVEGMLTMLRRLIGEDIDLAWLPASSLRSVRMDPAQLDQILANLCVNARDAIAGVGKLTIETEMKIFDEAYCNDHPGFVPGEFVRLTVSDDGCGMDGETLAKLFEPFFTTKEVGKGTGLGLATVYGIVKQNNGFINVYSEPGAGTTFKIYLPSHATGVEEISEARGAEAGPGRGETILLVEDEPAILALGKRMLESLDYRVLAAGTPGEALRLAREHPDNIALLITDVVMPEMNGRDLADQLHGSYPAIRTLFMSGYTANVIAHHGVLDKQINFIQKPFSAKDLAIRVREVLDQK